MVAAVAVSPLGRRAAFRVAAGVVAHTLWTSAAPAMAYRLYAEQWQLTHATITAIFAVYPIVVVSVLVVFGDLSDHIGRRNAMLLGLAASALGTALFALAPNVAWLFVGRVFMGVGVGLSAGPSTAAVLEFSPPGASASARASSTTTVAQAVGMASALLLGGALVEFAPWPTRLSFWLLFALLLGLLIAAWRLPRTAPTASGEPWRVKAPTLPRALRRPFLVASIGVATAYTHGALLLSLGGQVAHDLVGSTHAVVNGATLSLFAVMFGIVGVAARRLHHRPSMLLGSVASALGMALFALAVSLHSLAVFLLATLVSGAGYSLLVFGGLSLITSSTPAAHRGGVLSALYLVAYLSLGAVALALGAAATAWGLGTAVDLGAGAIGLASLVTLGLVARFDQSPKVSRVRPEVRPST